MFLRGVGKKKKGKKKQQKGIYTFL